MRQNRCNISNFKQILAGILLLFFSAYYANITLFAHYHVVDGVTIVHSHIYTGDHASAHDSGGHSDRELTLIGVISNYVAEAQESLHLDQADQRATLSPYRELLPTTFVAWLCRLPQLRAPPAATFCG